MSITKTIFFPIRSKMAEWHRAEKGALDASFQTYFLYEKRWNKSAGQTAKGHTERNPPYGLCPVGLAPVAVSAKENRHPHGDESTFTWCFDGEPERSTVAVSSIGTQRQQQTKAAFLRGYDAMLERLQPETILFWGNVPAECRGNICPVEAFYKTVERRREAKNVKS